MKLYPHQQFIEDNNLDIQILPHLLKKRILGFEELEEDLQHMTTSDMEKLQARLENLSNELEEDLDEHFEDQLENNDAEEEIAELKEDPEEQWEDLPEEDAKEELVEFEPIPVTSGEEPQPEPEPEPIPEPMPEPVTIPPLLDEEQKSETQQESQPASPLVLSDEEIIESFVTKGQLRVFPIELMVKGFKTALTSRALRIGGYSLRRGKYENFFTIHK